MTSIITSAAQTAHAAVASLLSVAQVKPGATVTAHAVKENGPTDVVKPTFEGRKVILFVPGAFTGTCHAQVPHYLNAASEFKAKGISEVWVVAVNDWFVMKAWKDNLAPEGTDVKFYADDTGAFASSLGLLFDATPVLGGPRAKRAVVVLKGNEVETVAVEEDATKVTVTDAKTVLAQLS
ncbi:Redoxin [Marasmius fiardii PR-910]|nr:Redoxin [Marasmius fiardii PR-910]